MLIPPLEGLRGIEPLGIHDRDLVTWWSRPEVPDWPVPKGRAWRQQGGGLTVKLDAEARREWQYLRQHLAESRIWSAIENCKTGLAHDLEARLQLLDRIAAIVQQPLEGQGLGLPIQADLGFTAVTRPEVTIYYLFTIYDQVLSRALGLQHAAKRREEFGYRDPDRPEIVYLGGIPVVRATRTQVRSRAVSFLLEAQEKLRSLSETSAAAQAYRAAAAAAAMANNEIQDVLLMPGFLPGSACDLCRPWYKPLR
jgi:hypothetical protein